MSRWEGKPSRNLRGEGDALQGVRVADGRANEPRSRQLMQTSAPIIPIAEAVSKAAFGILNDGLFATARGRSRRDAGDNAKTFAARGDTIKTFGEGRSGGREAVVFSDIETVEFLADGVVLDHIAVAVGERLSDSRILDELAHSIRGDKEHTTIVRQVSLGQRGSGIGDGDTVKASLGTFVGGGSEVRFRDFAENFVKEGLNDSVSHRSHKETAKALDGEGSDLEIGELDGDVLLGSQSDGNISRDSILSREALSLDVILSHESIGVAGMNRGAALRDIRTEVRDSDLRQRDELGDERAEGFLSNELEGQASNRVSGHSGLGGLKIT